MDYESLPQNFKDDHLLKVWKYIYSCVWSGETKDLNKNLERYGFYGKSAIFEGITPRFENI